MFTFIKNPEINLILSKKLKVLIGTDDLKCEVNIKNQEFTKKETEILAKLSETLEEKSCDNFFLKNTINGDYEIKVLPKSRTVTLSQLKQIKAILQEQRDKGKNDQFLHEILLGSKLFLPQNEIQERNPELEARCQKLKAELAKKEYHNMTRNVDSTRRKLPEDTISYQSKCKITYHSNIYLIKFIIDFSKTDQQTTGCCAPIRFLSISWICFRFYWH